MNKVLQRLQRIVSGGQTGVDRAALDVALDWNIPIGGWCPRGRRAEDGPIADRYLLKETKSPNYNVRTRLNVRDSDGTLILMQYEPVGGTALTASIAEQDRKPLHIVDLAIHPDPQPVIEWLTLHNIKILNIAGPRESTFPGIGEQTAEFLTAVLDRIDVGES